MENQEALRGSAQTLTHALLSLSQLRAQAAQRGGARLLWHDAALVLCLAEQTLREIELFVCFCDSCCRAVDPLLQCLQPRRDIGRKRALEQRFAAWRS